MISDGMLKLYRTGEGDSNYAGLSNRYQDYQG